MLRQLNFQKDSPVEAAFFSENEKFMDEAFKVLSPEEVMNMDYLRKSYVKYHTYTLDCLLRENYGDDFVEVFGDYGAEDLGVVQEV